MKKIIILIGLIIGFIITSCSPACGQTTIAKKITVNESDLTADQLAKVKAEQELEILNEKIEHYGKWIGVGNEVGTAMREGLLAVKDVAVEFADEDVGKYTMILIAWKVMGKDVMRIVIGIIVGCFIFCLIYRSFKRSCLPRKQLVEDPGFWKWVFGTPRKYEHKEPVYKDNSTYNNAGISALGWAQIIHIALFLISAWIVYGIMFAGS